VLGVGARCWLLLSDSQSRAADGLRLQHLRVAGGLVEFFFFPPPLPSSTKAARVHGSGGLAAATLIEVPPVPDHHGSCPGSTRSASTSVERHADHRVHQVQYCAGMHIPYPYIQGPRYGRVLYKLLPSPPRHGQLGRPGSYPTHTDFSHEFKNPERAVARDDHCGTGRIWDSRNVGNARRGSIPYSSDHEVLRPCRNMDPHGTRRWRGGGSPV
jgi:hypothetical protein